MVESNKKLCSFMHVSRMHMHEPGKRAGPGKKTAAAAPPAACAPHAVPSGRGQGRLNGIPPCSQSRIIGPIAHQRAQAGRGASKQVLPADHLRMASRRLLSLASRFSPAISDVGGVLQQLGWLASLISPSKPCSRGVTALPGPPSHDLRRSDGRSSLPPSTSSQRAPAAPSPPLKAPGLVA